MWFICYRRYSFKISLRIWSKQGLSRFLNCLFSIKKWNIKANKFPKCETKRRKGLNKGGERERAVDGRRHQSLAPVPVRLLLPPQNVKPAMFFYWRNYLWRKSHASGKTDSIYTSGARGEVRRSAFFLAPLRATTTAHRQACFAPFLFPSHNLHYSNGSRTQWIINYENEKTLILKNLLFGRHMDINPFVSILVWHQQGSWDRTNRSRGEFFSPIATHRHGRT